MADILSKGSGELGKEATTGKIAEAIHKLVTRRQFMRGAGAAGLGVTTFCLFGCGGSSASVKDEPQLFIANALGMIVSEPSRCVGCRRCELACSEYNDGKSQPAISRIKVGRNFNVGPLDAKLGLTKEKGIWGNHVMTQDNCRQCSHEGANCMLACPKGAIEVVAPLNARVVNVDKCIGCGICAEACPWGMITVDKAVNKASKCILCKECVNVCPTGSLQYVAWQDRAAVVPKRITVPSYIQSTIASSCLRCHK